MPRRRWLPVASLRHAPNNLSHQMKILLRRLARDYSRAMKEQADACELVESMARGGISEPTGYLFIGEHDPVYTLGKNGNASNLLVTEGRDGVPALVRTDRGGDITYHGPGQIVMYLVVHLPSLGLGARKSVELLEEAVIETLREFRIVTRTLDDAPGVWIPATRMRPLRKICALGIHINQGVTTHGIALNVMTDMGYFAKINPCGFTDRDATSMEQELYTPLDFRLVENPLLRHIANTLHLSYATH